jgi:hypothetical protein
MPSPGANVARRIGISRRVQRSWSRITLSTCAQNLETTYTRTTISPFMWCITQRYALWWLFANVFADFHPKNFLLGFDSTPLTVKELLAKDKAFSIYGDPAETYSEYNVGDGVMVRVYLSQPICLFSDGDSLPLDDLVVKIADFGKGILIFDTS